LAERGHPEVRTPHGNVFPFLDDAGTRVSVLAERAQITKQSMAELVAHLERHGYVERIPDPQDRRAKLVQATARGEEVYAIAREFVAELEADWTRRLGKQKMLQLRELLEELNEWAAAATPRAR
jgi:DNA-binding MarR family transcriptional regulator